MSMPPKSVTTILSAIPVDPLAAACNTIPAGAPAAALNTDFLALNCETLPR